LKPGQYVGAAACASGTCHGSVQPRDLYAVKQNEYFIWLKQDRHTQAYNVLLNEKSVRIARNLNLKEKAWESSRCLDCHAVNAPKSMQAQPLDLTEGVACEACHGPAGGWLAQHTASGWTHEASVKAGMKDLRDPVNRAQNCLACHLGSEQATVNHELIAAGHPDLIFELDNYTAVMPPHWTPKTSKATQAGREEMQDAKAWAIGQAVAFREGMRQIARHARSDNWPEFAEMNCYACHHSLADSEWRQIRGYKYKAGLPHWNPARYAVLRHLVALAAPQERTRLDADVEQLAAAIAKLNTPPATVAKTATGLAETIDRVIPQLQQARLDAQVARTLIKRIADDVPSLIDAEIHSVEQAIMAINALANAMARSNPAVAEGALAKTLEKLYDDVKDRERFDRKLFAQHVAEVTRQLP
jgi:hypothetical protein